MTDFTPPRVVGALPAIRCESCGFLLNASAPKAPCVVCGTKPEESA